ncbi:MAG: SDR family oxidoreductase [Anaerolineales bacterium]|nr:SDR family oxidoreductase [Anaerolineales bacterium]
MRILITGAAGFLGSHLCDRLLAEGHAIVGLDNFITGNPQNIAHLMGNERFAFHRHDVSNYIFVQGKVDAVMHFASPASPNPQSPSGYFNLPIQTMKAGALGTHNCLGVAKANNARFLLASTSEIYGDPLVHPQTEDYTGNVDPAGPRAVYDEAKRFAESITMAYHRFHGVDSRIVRIFNTYGPRMDLEDGRALPNLLKQALLGQPLTVYGDGSQTRSFCYVDDLVDGIVKLLYSDEHLPVNIGNQHEMTLLQFAESINRITGNQGGITYVKDARSVRDPQQRRPDITRAKTILKWEPRVSLDEGIEKTVPYFKQKLGLG